MRERTDFIIIHCSATPPDMDIGAAEISRWHVSRGFDEIGYHAVIRRDGRLETGRHLMAVGAHCRAQGRNRDSVGVCLVGGLAPGGEPTHGPFDDNFSPEQYGTLLDLIGELRRRWPHLGVFGHRDFDDDRACPAFDVADWLARGVDRAA